MGGRRAVLIAVYLLSMAASVPSSVRAQAAGDGVDRFRAAWMLQAGLARHGLADELASPLRHRGTGLMLGFSRGALGGTRGFALDASYWGPRIGSRVATAAGGFEDTHQIDLGLAWLAPVAELADGRVTLHLGGAVDARFSFRSHHYAAPGWDSRVERFGDLFVPLQPAAMLSVPLGGSGVLTHRVALPLLTLALRSPYTGLKYFPEAALEGPTSVTGFDSRLTYRRRTDGGWVLGGFYHATLVRYPPPRTLSSFVHRIGAEVGR